MRFHLTAVLVAAGASLMAINAQAQSCCIVRDAPGQTVCVVDQSEACAKRSDYIIALPGYVCAAPEVSPASCAPAGGGSGPTLTLPTAHSGVRGER